MIKSIETFYRGIRMRSRSEARWASFFDILGECWEYEPDHYELGLKRPYFNQEDEEAIRDLYEGSYDEDEIRKEIWYAKNEKLFYLPDFWIPALKHWVEVKGKAPNVEENRKARMLAYRTGYPVTILYGSVPVYDDSFQFKVFRSDMSIIGFLIAKYGEGTVRRAAYDAHYMRFDGPLHSVCKVCGVNSTIADSSTCKECWDKQGTKVV